MPEPHPKRAGGAKLLLGGGLLLLLLVALAPLALAFGDGPALAGAVRECEIKGLSEYAIEDTQLGACSPRVYVRACREAQQRHRERCSEFCTALKEVGGRQFCIGSSSPMARLFEPSQHCKEARHEQFEVSCRVTAACSCTSSATAGG